MLRRERLPVNEECSLWGYFISEKSFPQRLKPDSLQGSYVRAEARTLQRIEFFRSL